MFCAPEEHGSIQKFLPLLGEPIFNSSTASKMVHHGILPALFLAPTAILAGPAAWVSPYQCNILADIEFNSGDHCDGDTLVKINWQNRWTSYNYQHSSAKSFRLPGSDWSYAECYLYSDENATGNLLGTVYRLSGLSNCVSLPNGSSVKSVRCAGDFCEANPSRSPLG